MLSIRESTFETNSSSCHCIVFCKSDLRKKIENYECLYVGNFDYQDDYELYTNELDEKAILTRDEILNILKDFKNDTSIKDTYLNESQEWLKENNFENMSLYELMHCKQVYMYDILEKYGYKYTDVDTIFGGKDSDTYVYKDNEFLDKVTNEPISVLVTSINC